jgi:hypothetical protein
MPPIQASPGGRLSEPMSSRCALSSIACQPIIQDTTHPTAPTPILGNRTALPALQLLSTTPALEMLVD